MKVAEFVKNFQESKIMNTKINPNAVSDYLNKELEIKAYIPFNRKRQIAEMIVKQNISVVDGIKKYDDIGSYVSLIVASIVAHTNLQFSDDPVDDYDILAASGLLPQIIAEFQGSHEEIGILLKMAIASELEDNNVNVLVGRFLNKISQKLEDFNPKDIFGADIKEEDLAKFSSFLDKLK